MSKRKVRLKFRQCFSGAGRDSFKLFMSSSWRRWYDSFHLSSMQSEGESTFELLLKPTVTSNYNAKPSDKDQEVEKKRILFRSVFVLSW